MTRFKLMSRLTALAAAVVLAITALTGAVFAQQAPDHTFYGNDATAGDTIGVVGADGAELGSTTVAADGSWFVEVPRNAADGASFTVNGEAATADTNAVGDGLTEVSNLAVPPPPPPPAPATDCPDEGAMSEDSMGEDSMSEDSMSEDSMSEDSMSEGHMAEDCPEDAMGEDSMDEDKMLDGDTLTYPDTGSGGLADNGGISAGLLGLLIAIGAVAITGLGLRRVRNRA